MTRTRAVLRLLALAAVAAAAASRLHAQDARQPPSSAAGAQAAGGQPRPTFRVEASFVRVDAIVTKDGAPVTDLTAADFQVLEDDVRQELAAFERIDIATERRTATPRREPSSAGESREMAADPRARVFVLFLDRHHTGVDGSHRMRQALGRLLDRVIGPDDLVAVMTPEMSAADIAFTRRTGNIADMLAREWTWGVRGQLAAYDPEEEEYLACFPPHDDPARGETAAGMTPGGREPSPDVAQEMIARRREKRTLDALQDLSIFLRGVREERKAVLVVSEGWALYRPNDQLTLLGRNQDVPGRGVPGTTPQGRLVPDARQQGTAPGSMRSRCEADRLRLSMIDDQQAFLDLMDEANRANVSFYPIDPRGLPVFDTTLSETFTTAGGARGPMSVTADQRRLRDRIATLQTLAANTDGIAVVNSNDIETGLVRVVADLTSYYLLSYYSTNQSLDGGFRRITVRVSRPGVQVRARRGYRAATREELTRGPAAGGAPGGAMSADVATAFGALGGARGDARLRTRAGVSGAEPPRVWVLAELDPAISRAPEWSGGGTVQATLAARDGTMAASASGRIEPGSGVVEFELVPGALPPGDYQVRTRATPAAGGLPFSDVATVRVTGEAALDGAPRIARRGPTTGLAFVPTADLRFRRTERIRLEWRVPPGTCVSAAEVIDQRGQPMAMPVTRVIGACEPAGATGDTVGAEIVLAPLAPSDYGVRLRVKAGARDPREVVAAFRLVP